MTLPARATTGRRRRGRCGGFGKLHGSGVRIHEERVQYHRVRIRALRELLGQDTDAAAVANEREGQVAELAAGRACGLDRAGLATTNGGRELTIFEQLEAPNRLCDHLPQSTSCPPPRLTALCALARKHAAKRSAGRSTPTACLSTRAGSLRTSLAIR